jgi:hypothetical protein
VTLTRAYISINSIHRGLSLSAYGFRKITITGEARILGMGILEHSIDIACELFLEQSAAQRRSAYVVRSWLRRAARCGPVPSPQPYSL